MLCLHGGLTRSEDVSELKLKQMLFHFNFFRSFLSHCNALSVRTFPGAFERLS